MVDMMLLVVGRLDELAQKSTPQYVSFVAYYTYRQHYDSVDQELLLAVVCAQATRSGPGGAYLRQFHDGMRAGMRMDDGSCSNWFIVGHGLRQGCNLEPLLFQPLVCCSAHHGCLR